MKRTWNTNTKRWGVALSLVAVGVTAGLSGPVRASETAGQDQQSQPWVTPVAIGQSGRIGVSVRDVDLSADGPAEGAVVADVRTESPAETAGIAEGDVIVEFDSKRVRSARQLSRLVSETPAGRSVPAVVLRDGERVEVIVTPTVGSRARTAYGNRPPRVADRIRRDLRFAMPTIPGFGAWTQPGRLGIRVDDLTPQLADYFGVDEGVLVTMVHADTVAEEAGLQAGDVITAVDGRPVIDIGDLRRSVGAVEDGEEFSITVTRERDQVLLTARFEARRRAWRPPERPI